MDRLEDEDSAAPLRPGSPPRSRRRRAALILSAVLVAILVGLWIARRPLATRFVDRELARRGVPARYTVADLGLGRQRLTHVVIGNPADPDLVADWVETRIGYDLSGPRLRGVSAGRVRLRARFVDGRVSLGAIDRLLPPPSDKPFALPAIGLDVADARIRLETPAGVVGIRLAGEGRLDDGFAGRLAVVAPTLRSGDCAVTGLSAAVQLRIVDARPEIAGPVRADRLRCGAVTVAAPRADLTVTLGEALDLWRGSARLATGAAAAPSARAATTEGCVTFAGTARDTQGDLDLSAARLSTAPLTARRLTLAGRYRAGRALAFEGQASLVGAAVAPAALARATDWRDAAAGTPVAPLAAALSDAVARAGRGFAVQAELVATPDQLQVSQLTLAAASGARVALSAGAATLGPDGVRVDGALITSSGGLPTARVTLAQASPGAPVRGVVTVQPYAASGARLALAPVSFSATPGGATRIDTRATLSGPLGDGRVEALALPLSLLWNGRDRLLFNSGCAPLAWSRVAIGGVTLDPARLRLCPTGNALVRVDGGRVEGGARLAAARLTGALGGTPLTLDLGRAAVTLGLRGFTATDVAARLGRPGRESRLAVATLTGSIESGVTGRFVGAGGQIANVPLILSGAQGDWSLAGGVLALTGAMTVSDEATPPRFNPMAARNVALRLAEGRIVATGALHEPTTGTRVADVQIDHALSAGAGRATLDVPALAFREGFQPELLTRLTFGVVADVRGTVRGQGRIAWSPEGVTSTGEFGTEALDLAAAFGPVTGLATTLRFTDLLGMRTAPGQVATVETVNPGIPVTDGVIRYQLLSSTQVQVEGARWPFAGGSLTLEPTLLDFAENQSRRLTFRVDGMEAARFLQQFDFENLDATGVFDGVLPMVFDQSGGRIENGRLVVREGGGTIAYVGVLTQEQLGFWGDLAFQALKSLRYRSLQMTLNGPLTGEMITDVRFAGISQGAGAKSNILIRRLQRLPFVFNIRIKAPFRGLIDSAQSFYDPQRLIQRNLPALIDQQNRATAAPPIQPPASETVR